MSNFKQFLFLAAVFLLNNILTCESQSCSGYSTSTTCATNSQCSWVYRSGAYQCACASAVPEDVYFLMDISGSIGEEGWIEDTNFVSEMITTGLSNNSRVGIITFGTSVTIKYNLSQTQHPRSILTSLVTSMPYTGGSTYTKDGVSVSINQFKKWATKGYPRLLFIITDGKPNPSSTQTPCPLYSTLVAQNITVFIIGVTSSFSSAEVSCIVTNPSTNIVEASSFSNLASVRDYADNVLCPTSIQLTLTEVRIQNTSSSNSAIFIELYNSGSVTVDLKSNPLKFTGIVSGILNSSIHANISVGQYVVLYQASTSPNCTLCTCSMNSKGRCKNALYIPCNGKNCTFNSKYNGKTANNTNWGVAIQNTNGQAVILNVSYSKSTWPSVATGYTFELQSLLDDCTVGTNWAQSCWPSGTPGQGPLTSCTACKSSTCQQNGDTGAKCSGNTCNCTETKDYYLYSGTCYLTTNVTSCTTVLHKDSGGNSVDISWTAPTILAGHEYEISYPFNGATGSGTVSSNQAFFVYYDSTVTVSSTTPKVRVVVFDNTSTLTLSGTKVVYGSWVPCPIKTSSPTKAPTPEPTYAIPTIGCCNATITGNTGVIVKWCTPTFNYPTTPKNASSYKIYITCSGTNSTGYSTSRIYSNTISGCTVTSSSLTSIKVAPVVDLLTGSENDALMKQYAKSCTILTSAPTKTPTTGPTKPPTKKPTTGPTKPPTQRPTYPYYKVNSCNVIIGKGDSTINVTYTYSNPSNTSNPATYILYDKNTGTTSSFLGNPTTFSISGVLITDTSRFYVYPQFLAYPGGGYIGLACCNATCTITTVAPTRTPTGIPTHFPTGIPTHFPTALPSGLPTSQPTPFPTYGQVDIGQCKVVVAAGDSSFTISFYEPSDWSFPITSANYRIDNGNTFITYIQTGTAGDFIDKVIPYSINPADQIYVTVYYSISHAQGQSIQCNMTTSAPTKAPTQGPTTPAPTFSSPTVSFDSTQFGGSSCSYTTGNSYATCTVTAGQRNSFRVIRNPAGFSYGVSYQWVIVDSARRRMLYNASLFREATNGTNLINGSVGNEFDLLYYYYAGPSNTSKLPSFTFTIDLTNCYVNDTTYLANPPYPCSVVYPSQIIVTATYSYGKLTTNNVLGNLPTWIWYAIAAGVLIIPLLSYLGYRYYKKRKLAEMLTEQKKEELRDAEQLDDAGNFGGIGDAVAFNPLATGGTHDIATGGQYIDSQLDHQKQNFETAHVDVDVINFKQDFGQVQAVKR